jgi:hypothetical protein
LKILLEVFLLVYLLNSLQILLTGLVYDSKSWEEAASSETNRK